MPDPVPDIVPDIVMIRDMTDADADDVLRIYAEGIATGHATFEAEVPEWEQFFNGKRETPRLVAEANGAVVGWAACGSFSSRPVYAGVVEHSVYVSESARGLGIGHTLLSAFLAEAEQAGLWLIESRIFPENRGSLALHLACGFRVVGRYKRMGKMPYGPLAGQWRDCIIVAWRSEMDPE